MDTPKNGLTKIVEDRDRTGLSFPVRDSYNPPSAIETLPSRERLDHLTTRKWGKVHAPPEDFLIHQKTINHTTDRLPTKSFDRRDLGNRQISKIPYR